MVLVRFNVKANAEVGIPDSGYGFAIFWGKEVLVCVFAVPAEMKSGMSIKAGIRPGKVLTGRMSGTES